MKTKKIKVLAMSAALAAGFCLASCSTGKTTETKPSSTTQTVPAPTTTVDNFVKKDDYNDIAKSFKWSQGPTADYVFATDGIEEATLRVATDGDTAGFTLKNSGENITVRFYGIDTPESTGGVEKWGKYASKFCKAKLEGAAALLIESKVTKQHYTDSTPYSPAVDSYGVRKLAFVWYKETADSDWINLNLEMVENGFSINKLTVDEPYYKPFQEAHEFARKHQLHIHGNDTDPYYTDGYEQINLKALATDPDSFWNSEDKVGSKVQFDCYVKSCDVSSSGTYLFKVGDLDEDGKEYTFNVYTGYASSRIQTYFLIGGYYTVTGTLQNYNGSWQISGLNYVPMTTGGEYLTRKRYDYYMMFDSSKKFGDLYQEDALYGNAKVLTAEVKDNVLIMTAEATNTYDSQIKSTFTFTCPITTSVDASSLVGKTFSTTGLQRTKGTVEILKYSDISFK